MAFIISLFISFLFHMLFGLVSQILPFHLASIIHFLNLESHFSTMIRGIISFSSILYLISIIGIGLLLATYSLRKKDVVVNKLKSYQHYATIYIFSFFGLSINKT